MILKIKERDILRVFCFVFLYVLHGWKRQDIPKIIKEEEDDVIAKVMMNMATFERNYVLSSYVASSLQRPLWDFEKEITGAELPAMVISVPKKKEKKSVGGHRVVYLSAVGGAPCHTHTEFLNPNHSPSP